MARLVSTTDCAIVSIREMVASPRSADRDDFRGEDAFLVTLLATFLETFFETFFFVVDFPLPDEDFRTTFLTIFLTTFFFDPGLDADFVFFFAIFSDTTSCWYFANASS